MKEQGYCDGGKEPNPRGYYAEADCVNTARPAENQASAHLRQQARHFREEAEKLNYMVGEVQQQIAAKLRQANEFEKAANRL